MNYDFLVLVNGVGSYYNPFMPPVPPAVEIDGIAVGVFADIDAVAAVGAIMPLRVRQGV